MVVGGVLWTEEELFSKIEAKYGAKVVVLEAAAGTAACCAQAHVPSSVPPHVPSCALAAPPPPQPDGPGDGTTELAEGRSSGASVAVLFSGGVDCMVLAALADRHVPAHQPIDLLNVAFGASIVPDNGHGGGAGGLCALSPDRQGAISGLAELQQLCPSRQWQLILIDRSHEAALASRPSLLPLMFPAASVMDFTIGEREGVQCPSAA